MMLFKSFLVIEARNYQHLLIS